MLSRLSLRFITISLAFIASGMFLGNIILVYLGLVPMVFVLIGLYLEKPSEITVELVETDESVGVDKSLRLSKRVRIGRGFGPFIVSESLPSDMALSSGNNLCVLWKGFKEVDEEVSFEVIGSKRGVYYLEMCDVETVHALNLESWEKVKADVSRKITVNPSSYRFPTLGERKILELVPLPTEAQLQVGMPTSEFKEIRPYKYGDSYSQVNWKASAKSLPVRGVPMINTYEREGRRVVWFFLDSGACMALGSSLNNVFEQAVLATLNLSSFYLEKHCSVGLCIYNSDRASRVSKVRPSLIDVQAMDIHEGLRAVDAQTVRKEIMKRGLDFILYPDLGKRQISRIWQTMLDVEINEPTLNLFDSLERCRGYFKGTNPLFVIVTTIQERNVGNLLEALKVIGRYLPRRRKMSILVIHVSGYELLADDETDIMKSRILEYGEKQFLRYVRSRGIDVIHWNPSHQPITEALLSQVVI